MDAVTIGEVTAVVLAEAIAVTCFIGALRRRKEARLHAERIAQEAKDLEPGARSQTPQVPKETEKP